MLNWKLNSEVADSLNKDELTSISETYLQTINSPEYGFFYLPQNQELVKEAKRVYEKFKHKKFFIHIGIGGSALGAEMLIKGLGKKDNTEFVIINNIDPDDLHQKIESIDLKNSLIYVVSKSGTTAETTAALNIFSELLKAQGISESEFKDYFVFCTDPKNGDLRALSQEWNTEALDIPANIGGRFSVLTAVGLFPALFFGINVQELLDGAKDIGDKLSHPATSGDFYQLGAFLKTLHDKGFTQTVMMPYSSLLKEYSAWFTQLWAESLGKEGKGLTPIPAYGATDQHSQVQLFMEGPNDKVLMLIEVEQFKNDFSLKSTLKGSSSQKLSPYSLSQLMKAELEGTLAALAENSRPVVHLKIKQLDAYHLGQLILWAECLTVLVGQLLAINPFNQPGVEAGKKYAFEWLKSSQL